MKKQQLEETPAWIALKEHFEEIRSLHLRDLFKDKNRFQEFSLSDSELSLLFDYSKNRITHKTFDLLINLAKQCNIKERAEDLFSGKKINTTENRAVLHTALRDMSGEEIIVDGENVTAKIKAELEKIKQISEKIRTGVWKGSTGKKIEDIVHIGIGGSDLGPRMMYETLSFYHDGPRVHFVANIDGSDIHETLKVLNPETTLIILASKSFTTEETMQNLDTAINWLGSLDVKKHCIAITANKDAVKKYTIDTILLFWDFVGGRYSVWSAVGLSLACAYGFTRFYELLEGANATDHHLLNTPYEKNIPIILGMLGIWYNNFFGAETHAVIPYSQYLSLFPMYLQQIDMESNGKSVDSNGKRVTYQTGPIIWGAPGTNAEHSFFQLLHQGTKLIPLDFIVYKEPLEKYNDHHDRLVAHCLAQGKALAFGEESTNPYESFEGNHPTTTLFFDKLTPKNLGALCALYEHTVFVEGSIWNINSFDQFGVQLGKKIAREIFSEIKTKKTGNHDSSTQGLLKTYLTK